MKMISRAMAGYASYAFSKYPVVTITGPRQSGKTTLARTVFAAKPYANLEHPVTRQFAEDDPVGFLAQYPDGAVIDEIQRVPTLLSYIQVIVDDLQCNSLFVLTGSHQFELMHGVSQSLAGRTALLKLLPLSIAELRPRFSQTIDEMLFKGFYPRIYDQDLMPTQAYGDYFETYIQRDLRQLINVKNLSLFERFVKLCAGRCGQLLNLHSLASDTGVSQSTAREWLTILEASYIVFLLQPFHANIGKRLIKSPKIYFYDVGLASWLCGIEALEQLPTHPLRGNFFENMVVMEVLKHRYNRGQRNNLFFYRDSNGNEIDILYTKGKDVLPIEVKSGQTITSSYFKGLQKFKALFTDDIPWGDVLVYGGDVEQKRQQTTVLQLSSLDQYLHKVEEQ